MLLPLTKLEFVSLASFQKLHASFPAANVPVGPVSFDSARPRKQTGTLLDPDKGGRSHMAPHNSP